MFKKILSIVMITMIIIPLNGFQRDYSKEEVVQSFNVTSSKSYYIESNNNQEEVQEEPKENDKIKLETKEEREKREDREKREEEEAKRKKEEEIEKRKKEEGKKKKKKRMKKNEDGELVEETEEEQYQREMKEEEERLKKEEKARKKAFNNENVEYTIELECTWTKETHPKDYPENGYITEFLGVSHNKRNGLWKNGGATSEAFLKLIKEGDAKLSEKEMKKSKEKERVNDIFKMEGIKNLPGTTSGRFKVCRARSYVTVGAGIIPSSDWFVGISTVNLLEEDKWVKEKEVILYAYDGGTHEGNTYVGDFKKSKTPSKIIRLEREPFLVDKKLVPVGKVRLKLMENNTFGK